MASSQDTSQIVRELHNTIRQAANSVNDRADGSDTGVISQPSGEGASYEAPSKITSALLLLLEEDGFSAHTIRIDRDRNEYNIEPHQIRVTDKPDGTGGVNQTKIPYCFTSPIEKKRWEVSFIHPGSRKQWMESHNIIDEFFSHLGDSDEEVRPLVKAILSLLYTPESLDSLDVDDFIIALPEGSNVARFDELKKQCAEELPRKIQHKVHLRKLLTEKCRYANTPANPSPLFSLLRSVDGLPSAEQCFIFSESSSRYRIGFLKEGRFEERICKPDQEFDLSMAYAVGIVDGGEIRHAISEEGYHNFRDMHEALYKAKTLAIVQESALEVYRIAELKERLSSLRAEAETLAQTLKAQKETLARMIRIREALRRDTYCGNPRSFRETQHHERLECTTV